MYGRRQAADPNLASPEPEDKRRVRIAVLDTGVDQSHELVNAAVKRQRIVKCRSFIDGSTGKDVVDTDGHGTHITVLLNKVAPDADIYVAKVFEKRSGDSHQPVVQAIQHATKQAGQGWNVDIICMAFGFPRPVEELRLAILEAAGKNVLMFAAATNEGGNVREPMYPARDPNVFCIHATDGYGAWQNFNTVPKDTDFSTLGVGVLSARASCRNLNGVALPLTSSSTVPGAVSGSEAASAILSAGSPLFERRSGTSVACAIACGITALVLELTRQPELDDDQSQYPNIIFDPGELAFLHTSAGMARVLNDMSLPDDHTKFRYIAPWNLISIEKGSGWPSPIVSNPNMSPDEKKELRKRRASRICVRLISSALCK